MQEHISKLNGHLQETQIDTKPIHEHNAIPLNSTEPMQDKVISNLDEECSATDKSPDLEVNNILTNSKIEQPTIEHRANPIVSAFCWLLIEIIN